MDLYTYCVVCWRLLSCTPSLHNQCYSIYLMSPHNHHLFDTAQIYSPLDRTRDRRVGKPSCVCQPLSPESMFMSCNADVKVRINATIFYYHHRCLSSLLSYSITVLTSFVDGTSLLCICEIVTTANNRTTTVQLPVITVQ